MTPTELPGEAWRREIEESIEILKRVRDAVGPNLQYDRAKVLLQTVINSLQAAQPAPDRSEGLSYPKQPCCDSAVEAASLRLLTIKMEGWWHREWHKATGIPCDSGSEYCPMTRREFQAARVAALAATAQVTGVPSGKVASTWGASEHLTVLPREADSLREHIEKLPR